MQLLGQRIILRPATPADAEAMLAYLADPVVCYYLTHPPLDLDDVRTRLSQSEPAVDDERFNILFAVVLGAEVIGEAHAWNVGEHHQPASPDSPEVWIGFALNPPYEGRGLASEAVTVLLDWLQGRGVRDVFANLYADNERSEHLLQRLGFKVVLRFSANLDRTGKARTSLRMVLHLQAR